MYSLTFFFVLTGFSIAGADGLKNVRLESPGYARQNTTVTLTCNYELEGNILYAVNWFRGASEFYRYVPKEVPPTKVFPFPGIFVNVSQSNDHRVVLENVSIQISGKYKCSVSIEGTFQTLADIQELNVLAIGHARPRITVVQELFNPRDTVKAVCTLLNTSPQVNITWYLDDQEIRPGLGYQIRPSRIPNWVDPSLETTQSTLFFSLPDSFDTLRLNCTATIYNLYKESTVYNIEKTRPPQSSAGTSFPSSATSRGPYTSLTVPAFAITIITLNLSPFWIPSVLTIFT